MPSLLNLRLLGPFEARRANGDRIDIPSAKGKALLAYLAMVPEHRHTREHLASLLWDRSDAAHARASLRQAIRMLRRVLKMNNAEGVLHSDLDTVFLAESYVHVDALDIDQTLEHRAVQMRDGAEQFEFLAGLNINAEPFEDWRRDTSLRVHAILERRLKLLFEMADTERACGDDTKSVEKLAALRVRPEEPVISSTTSIPTRPLDPCASTMAHSALDTGMECLGLRRAGGVLTSCVSVTQRAIERWSGSLSWFRISVFYRLVAGALILLCAGLFVGGAGLDLVTRQSAAAAGQGESEVSTLSATPTSPECGWIVDDPIEVVKACTVEIARLQSDDRRLARLLTFRGVAHRWSGDFGAARRDLLYAVEIDPHYYDAHHNLAYTYYSIGEYERALSGYDTVLEIRPAHFMAKYRKGEAQLANGLYHDAINTFTMAIEQDPGYGHAYLKRGEAFIALGDTAAAQADFRLAASHDAGLRNVAEGLYAKSF